MTTGRPNRIRYFRRIADLSQDALAERMGVHRQTVSDWERGVFRPELETAIRLARELGCSMDLLFMAAESGEAPDDLDTIDPSAGVSGASGAGVASTSPDRTGAPEPVGNRPGISGVST